MRALAWTLLVAGTLLLGLTGLATATPSLTVLDADDVTIANPSETMTERNFSPKYVFSAEVRVTNDDQERSGADDTPPAPAMEAWMYEDPAVEGCPEDERSFPVSPVRKSPNLEPREERRLGGATSHQDGDDAYWPLAVSDRYRDAETGEEIEIGDAEYTFCVLLRVSGNDPECDKPSTETCVIARDDFQTYVRAENQAPEITEFSISDENPDPGGTILLEGDAVDEDTQPQEDDLRFTWIINGHEETGRTVQYAFPTAETYTVTLEVTDGFDTVERSMEVQVGSEDGGPLDETPLEPLFALLAAGAAAVLRRG